MKMVHEIKNVKTKLSRLGIDIGFVFRAALWAAVIWLFYRCGASVSTVVWWYLGYRVLRLAVRLLGLIFAAVFTVVSIFILLIIISLIII